MLLEPVFGLLVGVVLLLGVVVGEVRVRRRPLRGRRGRGGCGSCCCGGSSGGRGRGLEGGGLLLLREMHGNLNIAALCLLFFSRSGAFFIDRSDSDFERRERREDRRGGEREENIRLLMEADRIFMGL